MRRIILMTIAALHFTFPNTAAAGPHDLFIDAVNMEDFERIEGCEERDAGKLYVYCVNSDEVFAKAKAFAKERDLPLMIIWGFDACPACAAFEAENFEKGYEPLSAAFRRRLTKKQKRAFKKYSKEKKKYSISPPKVLWKCSGSRCRTLGRQ